jgi:hypothetical protein
MKSPLYMYGIPEGYMNGTLNRNGRSKIVDLGSDDDDGLPIE